MFKPRGPDLHALRVTLVCGEDLLAVDANGKSDPYVVVTCGRAPPAKTAVKRKNLNPAWHEQFTFHTTERGAATELVVEVYDHDKFSADDLMGVVALTMADVRDGALGIAGMLMERPLVLYVNDANGARQPLYSREKALSALPLQVWVDAKTASSGEVLAGALHDNCRAAVLGQRTYGKGVIQGVFGLSNGGALIETVASYATPTGCVIHPMCPEGSATSPSETRSTRSYQ